MVSSSSQISSRASLCGVPGSGASNASAQSSALSQMSAYGVSTSMPSVGGSSYSRTAGSIACTISAEALSAATSGSLSTVAVAPSGDEVPQGAGLHALLPEAGEDVGDVGQIGLVRPDEQHAAPAMTEARVGVEEVGGAVQGDDGLPRARTAVDDEGSAGPGTDDRVLVGLDGAEHVAHPGRAVAAQARDER